MPYQLLAVLKVERERESIYEVVSGWMENNSGSSSADVYRNFLERCSRGESLGNYVFEVGGMSWFRRIGDSLFSRTRERAIKRQERLYHFQGKLVSKERDRTIRDILKR